jgi:hypothetical protein
MAHGKTVEMTEFSKAHRPVTGIARLLSKRPEERLVGKGSRDRSLSGNARIRARRAGYLRGRS